MSFSTKWLEEMTGSYGTIWTSSELVYRAYQCVEPYHGKQSITILRSSLTADAYSILQRAARDRLASVSPGRTECGIGFITVEAPVAFTRFPVEFLEFLADDESPSNEKA